MENATSGTTTTTTTTSTTSASADIFNDGTDSNETRLGAIMDLKLGLDHFLGVTGGGGGGGEVSPRANSTAADVLVIAGDTLFLNDFSLDRFLRLARHLNNNNIIQNNNNGGGGAILVSVVELEDENGTYKSGILELDDSLCIRVDDEEKKEENKKATTNNKTTSLFPLTSCKRVVKFLEKPGPLATKSRLSCPCFYYLPFSAIHLLSLFISEKTTGGAGGGDTRPRLEDVDATGKFVEWLINDYGKMPVYAVQASGRLDIGGLESYLIADKYLMAG